MHEIIEYLTEVKKYKIKEKFENRDTVVVLDGEKMHSQQASFVFSLFIFVTAVLALVTNSIQVVFRKGIFQNGFRASLWNMGRDANHYSSIFFDVFSNSNHETKVKAASYWALKPCYNFEREVLKGEYNKTGSILEQFFSRIMGRTKNRLAVSNRLTLAVDMLVKALHKYSKQEEIRLLSVASGSAQAVIEALSRVPELNVQVVLIDIDKTALAEAHRLCKQYDIDPNRFTLVHGRTSILEEVCKNFQPHIIEMVGFLDYRSREKAIELIGRLQKCLLSGGVLITCNIRNNAEKIFLDWVLLWPMIYRSESEFMKILDQSGFENRNIALVYEPEKIHGIAYCIKK